jgi:hypothetical protein
VNKLATLILALCLTSCSWFNTTVKPVIDNKIDCIKAAEAQAAGGKDPIQIAIDIADALGTAAYTAATTGGDLVAALEAAAAPLIVKYGEPVVACVFKGLEPTIASAAKKAAMPNPFAEVISHHGWTFK